jgi:uncharacterized membrane protein YfcA
VRLAPASVAGALVEAVLLLVLPDDSFKAIVPALIALAWSWWSSARACNAARPRPGREGSPNLLSRVLLTAGIFALGVYGGTSAPPGILFRRTHGAAPQ